MALDPVAGYNLDGYTEQPPWKPATPFIDLAIAAFDVGFRGQALVDIVAITVPESGRISNRIVKEPSTPQVPTFNESYGLTCVNKIHLIPGGMLRTKFTVADLLTVKGNLEAAWMISAGGTSFKPWMTYTADDGGPGAYRHSLDAATVGNDGRARLDVANRKLAAANAQVFLLQTKLAEALTEVTRLTDANLSVSRFLSFRLNQIEDAQAILDKDPEEVIA